MMSNPHDAIELRLGQRRKLRALHAHVGAALVDRGAGALAGVAATIALSVPQNGCANADVRDQPSPKNVLMRPRVRSKN